MDFLKRMFKSNQQLYPELKPKDRIGKIVVDHILPQLKDEGFRFVKSSLSLKRKVEDFEHEIWFRPSRNNSTGIIVDFDPHVVVTSREYQTWYKKTYQKNPNSNLIGSARAEYIPNWDKQLYDGWYDLAKHDNNKVIELVVMNLKQAGLPFMETLSSWQTIIDYYLENPGYYLWPDLVDYSLIDGNESKAIEVFNQFWVYASSENCGLAENVFEQMLEKETKLDELGLLKLDLSKYPIQNKDLTGENRVFLTNNEAEIRNNGDKAKDEMLRLEHLTTSTVEIDGIEFAHTTHIANSLRTTESEKEEFQKNSDSLKFQYLNTNSADNIRFRINDIAFHSDINLVASAHNEGTGIIWSESLEIKKVFDFTDLIPNEWNELQQIVPLKGGLFAFGTHHSYFICNENEVLYTLMNNNPKKSLKNLFFKLKPHFGKIITAGFREGKIMSWDYDSNIVFELKCEDKFIPAAYNEGKDIFLLDNEKGLRRIVNRIGEILFEYNGVKDNDTFVFSPNGEYLVESGYSSKIILVNLTSQETKTLKAHNTRKKGYKDDFAFSNFGTNVSVFSNDSQYLAVGADYGVNVLWYLDDLERKDLMGHKDDKDLFQNGTKSMSFFGDKYLLTGDKDGTAILWDMNSNLLARLVGHNHAVSKAIFGKNSESIYTSSEDMTIKKWKKRV